MSTYIGGGIGYNIWSDRGGSQTQNVGFVGNPNGADSAPGVEIRGRTQMEGDYTDLKFSPDYYQGTGSWFRQGYGTSYDETHISSAIKMSAAVPDNQLAGFYVTVYDAWGKEVYSGIDFVIPSSTRTFLGEEPFRMLEDMDNDFVSAPNQVGTRNAIEWDYPVVTGVMANTFVVGIVGFTVDTNGAIGPANYTLDWSFS